MSFIPRCRPSILLGSALYLLVFSLSARAVEKPPTPLFSRSFDEGRLILAEGAGHLFVLSKPDGTISRLSTKTWTLTPRLQGLNHPENMAVSRFGHRLLVDLDSSRSLLIGPTVSAGPPLLRTVGLNPGQIIGGPDDHFYLVARGVHILYELDRDRYEPTSWMAVGEAFGQASTGMDGHLWLPLNLTDSVMEIGTNPLAVIKTTDLDRCIDPVRVLPLPEGGFLAGCHDAIIREGLTGETLRFPLRGRFRRGVRDLVLFPGSEKVLALFHKSKNLIVFEASTLKEKMRIRFPFRPVRLYIFPSWPILFVVMNDPDHDETWLFGYPLSIISQQPSGQSITSKVRTRP